MEFTGLAGPDDINNIHYVCMKRTTAEAVLLRKDDLNKEVFT